MIELDGFVTPYMITSIKDELRHILTDITIHIKFSIDYDEFIFDIKSKEIKTEFKFKLCDYIIDEELLRDVLTHVEKELLKKC